MRTLPRFPPRDDCYDVNPETQTPIGSNLGSRSEWLNFGQQVRPVIKGSPNFLSDS